MANDELSLKNLTPFPITPEMVKASLKAVQDQKAAYIAKYGKEEGERRYYADIEHNDDIELDKTINTNMYHMGRMSFSMSTHIPKYILDMFDDRRREVYGVQYDEIINSPIPNDPRIAELLIQEAIQTGNWEVLPDELIDEYRKRTES